MQNYNFNYYRTSLEHHINNRANGNVVGAAGADSDSFVNANMQRFVLNIPWEQFNDFKVHAVTNIDDDREVISVDIPWNTSRVWGFDNHVQRANPSDTLLDDNATKLFNLNNDLYNVSAKKNYIGKFAMSSSIMFYAMYKNKFKEIHNEALKVLIALDGGYKGAFKVQTKDYTFDCRDAFISNLEMLGISELLEIVDAHSLDEWEQFANKITKAFKIILNHDGYLQFKYPEYNQEEKLKQLSEWFGFEFELPSKKFYIVERFEYIKKKVDWKQPRVDLLHNDDFITFAYTYSSEYRASKRIDLLDDSWTYRNITHKEKLMSERERFYENGGIQGFLAQMNDFKDSKNLYMS